MTDPINAHDHPPLIITEPIRSFCRNIVPDAKPVYVQYAPIEGALPSECFDNVDAVVASIGGSRLLGWSIGIRYGVVLGAEAHAIWSTPEGKWRDITPQKYVENQTLFLPDTSMDYHGQTIRTQFRVLVDSADGRKLEESLNTMMEIIQSIPKGISHLRKNHPIFGVQSDVNQRLIRIARSIGRNNLCPCGSGRKYKRCCGV